MKTNDSAEEANATTGSASTFSPTHPATTSWTTKPTNSSPSPVEGLEDKKYYLQDGHTYYVVIWEGTPIDIKIPYKIVLVVKEAHEA
jgi:elongation factor P